MKPNHFLAMLCAMALAATTVWAKPLLETKGPNGNFATSFYEISLSSSQEKKVSKKKLKAAILMHTSSDFSNALVMGAKEV